MLYAGLAVALLQPVGPLQAEGNPKVWVVWPGGVGARPGSEAWNRRPAAPNRGRVASGRDRVASGRGRVASGRGRVASGRDRVASGRDRVASGRDRVASGRDRVASGRDRMASGRGRVASGNGLVRQGGGMARAMVIVNHRQPPDRGRRSKRRSKSRIPNHRQPLQTIANHRQPASCEAAQTCRRETATLPLKQASTSEPGSRGREA